LGAELGEVKIARRSDQQVDLIEGCRKRLTWHGGKGGFPNRCVLDRVVDQHGTGATQFEGGGIKIANGAQPRALADRRRVGE
jgi:hypothetical protein